MRGATGICVGTLTVIIYSNDLPDILNITKAILFDDDTTVYHSSNIQSKSIYTTGKED